jgi:L-threonylcarbamoyladenylate synthase
VRQLPIMTIISSCTLSTLREAAKSLKQGNLVAFPTETVYGLGADATNKDAVARIYDVKGRPTGHPLIVHISSMNNLDKWAQLIPEYAITFARTFWPGPMTLILPRTELAKDFVTGGQDNVGIRVPSHPLALSLLKEFEALGGLGIAAPSANRFGKVSPTSAQAVQEELSEYLTLDDLILDGGPCQIGIESTIIDCTKQTPQILRPGGVTQEQIAELINLELDKKSYTHSDDVKAPGLLESHYSPKAKVFLSGTPQPGDGFLALSSIATPTGAIRLATPVSDEDYARQLYSAFRLADSKKIERIFAVPLENEGIAVAINNRLSKAAHQI